MSGGSFNYLCHTWDLPDLVTKQGDLEDMAQALAALGYAKDAARETEELLVILRQWEVQAGVRLDRLREVWKAMEWWRSCDWSEAQLKAALAEYRGEPKEQPAHDAGPDVAECAAADRNWDLERHGE